ncbi:MAG: N-6 DNA methylase [Elusimicrobia bacterium]|nr:N-6 DNA methylase [Elusimicrobiota bacterium]
MQFNAEYNREIFNDFLRDKFLPEDYQIKIDDNLKIPENLNKIKKLSQLGYSRELELIVYEAKHNCENDPRVTLSKEIFRLMREYDAKRALVIFTSPNSKNYRFSLVTIDFKAEGKKIKKEYSNPRRYSFFLGPEAKTHTPEQYLAKTKVKDFKDLQERFSIEVVTKKFFSELSNWYFWALKNTEFPEAAEKETNGKNIALIRFITRIIFIWFMKQKGLISDDLFNEAKIKEILKDASPGKDTYYKAILQNLFFATLNTPIENREFRREERYKGYLNKDYMKHNYYRYHNLFKNPAEMLAIFEDIPFLNGGLFECLDKRKDDESNDTKNEIRIDGFSDDTKKQPHAPNFLFFSNEIEVDLNKDYGTKNKKYTTHGIINLLETYNFTVDESTPIDVEIAIDPEMLGRIFENLLASYNPETSTTARKSTGSYYTPRPIVEYMVDESLKEYFKTKLRSPNLTENLEKLFSHDTLKNPFSEQETDTLIEAINNLKILDPAVGSGAFPMGVLQRLVFLLSELDPHNEKWKQRQIDAINKNIPDTVLKKDLIDKVEINFNENELNYGRKLYLIQNCIYGVDIQPIAIHIARLRFFISLLVDEKVNKDKDNNFGIQPLPNLETKFVSANTLIGLEQEDLLPMPKILELEGKLKSIRDSYFSASNVKEKEKLKKRDKETREELGKAFKQFGNLSKNTEKIVNWNPYNSNKSAEWFDPEWMFGMKEGFDIVIANPPYINIFNIKDKNLRNQLVKKFSVAKNKTDLYAFFVEKGMEILKEKGKLVYIFSNSWLGTDSFSKFREFLINETRVEKLVKCPPGVFENATVTVIIIILTKAKTLNNSIELLQFDGKKFQKINYELSYKFVKSQVSYGFTFDKQFVIRIPHVKLGEIAKFSLGIKTADDKRFILDSKKDDNSYKLLRGKDIGKYFSIFNGKWIWYKPDLMNQKMGAGPRKSEHFLKSKILIKDVAETIQATLDTENHLTSDTVTIIYELRQFDLKFILALLNAKLINKWFKMNFPAGLHIKINQLENIPIPKESHQKPFIKIVDKILALKSKNPDADTSDLETQIDQMVYKLYNLTDEEIRIVENKL